MAEAKMLQRYRRALSGELFILNKSGIDCFSIYKNRVLGLTFKLGSVHKLRQILVGAKMLHRYRRAMSSSQKGSSSSKSQVHVLLFNR